MNTVSTRKKHSILLALILIMAVALLLAVRTYHGAGGSKEGPPTTPGHSMADVSQAKFLSIFIYDGNGGVSSFMVGGSTAEFSSLANGIEEAKPAGGQVDASFSDLIVFSYAGNQTVEFPYSSARNQFAIDDQVFNPHANLAPLIDAVAKRLT